MKLDRPIKQQFAKEVNEVLWDLREATIHKNKAEAAECTAHAKYQCAMLKKRQAVKDLSEAREEVMRCKKKWTPFIDIREYEKRGLRFDREKA